MKTLIFLPTTLEQEGVDMFSYIMGMHGKAYRDVGVRKTVQVNISGKSYFIKQHFGVGWREIFKNLFSFKLPILGAITEVKAIQKLGEIGIPTTPLVAYGTRGYNPAKLQSFIMTEDLGNIVSLEDFCAGWKVNPPTAKLKRQLIIAVAKIASNLHLHGINHRDFYLCHLCLDVNLLAQNQIKLYLIDLHRMQVHRKPSVRLNMKDVAALYFSSMDIGLSARDLSRFKKYYLCLDSAQAYDFWQQVTKRAQLLYVKFHSDKFQKRLLSEKSAIS